VSPPAPARAAGRRWIALLGKQDQPTDALFDYCGLLGNALEAKGYSLGRVRFEWPERGWAGGWRHFQSQLSERADWVFVQYTHLAWSQRGFPLRFPWLIQRLRRSAVGVAVVFHDPGTFGGHRGRDRLRRRAQVWAMRRAAWLADKIVTTIPPECVPWMRNSPVLARASAIPVGSNLPSQIDEIGVRKSDLPAVIVFGVTENGAETPVLASVAQRVSRDHGAFRLVLFGRGASAAAESLRPVLAGTHVLLESQGIVPPEEGSALLAQADVQLFVRGGVSSRRGSAIAGICCGLPLVGFAGDETASPITEAGVRLVPFGDQDGLVRELVSVLRDEALRLSLRQRSMAASQQYFSWERIADQYIAAIPS
jgi:glycosyltransferase involved in cell wall biosynthesis